MAIGTVIATTRLERSNKVNISYTIFRAQRFSGFEYQSILTSPASSCPLILPFVKM